MKDLLMFFVHFILLSLILTVSGDEIVYGQLSETVVLPCTFNPNSNEIIIHWQRSNGQSSDIIVHSYYHSKDHLEKQNVTYQNRTSLFYSDFPKGNASLELRHLRLEDEGVYKCYMGKEYNVNLKIISFKNFSLNRQNTTTRLECAAWDVHLLPSITWSDASGIINETNRTEVKTDRLMSVISEINITNSSQVYQCQIHNSVPNLNWTGIWNMTDPLNKVEGDEAVLQCDIPHSLNVKNIRVTWSVAGKKPFACVDNISEMLENSRFSWVSVNNHQTNASIILKNLKISDSEDYVCNISSHDYMQLRVTSLTVAKVTTDKMENRYRYEFISLPIIAAICIGIGIGIYCFRRTRKGMNGNNQSSIL
uniref:HERV-H LTR-associating protein 2 isoform X2 n=1 Tax=Geotrypetes seraphini TaxID=260995 RepID=A0A6P8RAF7_GEOSA|nr:HERV-H LTR-associating protein 2 isoform X2 [Geotrypetes seraphini]